MDFKEANYLGPDQAPRPAELVETPSGSCDSHAHIVGPHARYSIPPTARAVPPEATLGDYLAMTRALGIERAVLVQPSVYGVDNSLMLDALRDHPQTLRGIAIVGFDTVSVAQLSRLRSVGVRGLRFNMRGSSATSAGSTPPVPFETIRRVGRKLAESGLHAQLLLVADSLPQAFNELRGLPVDVVIDHMGYLDPRHGLDSPGLEMIRRWLDTGGCWVKLSAPYRYSNGDLPYERVVPLARRLAETAPERMLWASDWPHSAAFPVGGGPAGPVPNDGALLDLLADWVPDKCMRRRILVENPARLYDFANDGRTCHVED